MTNRQTEVNRIVENAEHIPTWIVEKAATQSGRHWVSFAAAVRSGMKIAAGTDPEHRSIPISIWRRNSS